MSNKNKNNTTPSDLERYVQEHRPEFDRVESVDEAALWEKIQPHTPRQQQAWTIQLGTYSKWSIAASVAILLVAVFYLGQESGRSASIALADYAPELQAEAEAYQQLIHQKEANLDLAQLDQQFYREIFDELALLESLHQEMMQELPAFSDQERLINNLKKYYERKLFLLEKLSREIEKNKKRNNETNPPTLM